MPPFTRLTVPDALLAEVVAHARAASPLECCGLLAGTPDGIVSARYPVANAANSTTAYETDARDMLRAFRDMRGRGIDLLAIYHSHPASGPIPSARDLAHNTYGESVVHLIVGLAGAEPEVRAWWLGETGFRAAEFAIADAGS